MKCLILVATLGGIFSLILGLTRILYAAGAEGNVFKVFGRVHPTGRFPTVSLLAMSVLAIPLCRFSLGAAALGFDDYSDCLPVHPSDSRSVRHPQISKGNRESLRHVAISNPRAHCANRVDICRSHSGTAPERWHGRYSFIVGIWCVLSSGEGRQIMAFWASPRPLESKWLTLRKIKFNLSVPIERRLSRDTDVGVFSAELPESFEFELSFSGRTAGVSHDKLCLEQSRRRNA